MKFSPPHLWTCPICGRTFRAANTYHSCGQYALDGHFTNKNPLVRELYDFLEESLRQFGPVAVFPLKTRIVFQAEVQFAAAVAHKNWLEGQFWLRRNAAHPRIQRVEMGVFRDYGHIFKLTRVEDLDDGLIKLLHEAYVLGLMVE